jgi:lysozyme
MIFFDKAAELIREFEGLRLEAYPDPASGGEPWTIGYGHTKGVRKGQKIDLQDAEAMLIDDMSDADDCIGDWVDIELTDNERAALISFIFNLGCGAFRGSTLLKMLNADGDRNAIAAQFLRWNKAGGKVMNGLTRRREAERKLFLAV